MSQQNVIGKTKYNLGEDKWFANSGLTSGDVSAPATIELINIPNTGLRNAYVKIQAFYGKPIDVGEADHLGILVKINDTEIIKSQPRKYENNLILIRPRHAEPAQATRQGGLHSSAISNSHDAIDAGRQWHARKDFLGPMNVLRASTMLWTQTLLRKRQLGP